MFSFRSSVCELVAIIFCRREIFSIVRTFLKQSLSRRDRFRPKIIEIGTILMIFKLFQVLQFGKNLNQIDAENIRHFSANSANCPRMYIETHYKTNFPGDVWLNSSKLAGAVFRKLGLLIR